MRHIQQWGGIPAANLFLWSALLALFRLRTLGYASLSLSMYIVTIIYVWIPCPLSGTLLRYARYVVSATRAEKWRRWALVYGERMVCRKFSQQNKKEISKVKTLVKKLLYSTSLFFCLVVGVVGGGGDDLLWYINIFCGSVCFV